MFSSGIDITLYDTDGEDKTENFNKKILKSLKKGVQINKKTIKDKSYWFKNSVYLILLYYITISMSLLLTDSKKNIDEERDRTEIHEESVDSEDIKTK